MKLVRYGEPGMEKAGIYDARHGVIRSLEGLEHRLLDPEKIADLIDFLGSFSLAHLPIVQAPVRLGPPIQPRKIVGVGLNYTDHAKETNLPLPSEPLLFIKADTSLSGPNDPIQMPFDGSKLDWEIELAIVIGRRAKEVNAEDAMSYVAGYCLANDVSERAFQFDRGGTLDKGKGCESFCPLGPWLVTPDEVPDPQDLTLRLEVNGNLRQSGNTSNMVFKCAQLVTYVSRFMTLRPCDVILTGTPAGVGLGMAPPTYLAKGDIVHLEIPGLGTQSHRVI